MERSARASGPIAQMNWGRMKFDLGNPRLREFENSLEEVYTLAEQSTGFVWRISDEEIAAELKECGFDGRTSATVSVWKSYGDLHRYTFESLHGKYLDRRREWFEQVEGPRLVIWNVTADARPSFAEALMRLEHLKTHGASSFAFCWEP